MTSQAHAPHTRLTVTVLGSGSSGNSIAIRAGDDTLLVDAGFSARETMRRLEASGIDAAGVRAIVITHEHGDHVRGVRVLAKRLGVPVYASPGTRRAAGLDSIVSDPRDLERGATVRIAQFSVTAFATSHDAAEPVGLRVESPGGIVCGILTDSGVVTPEALEALRGCDVLALESNHDLEMLRGGPYPYFLKQRILSSRGHLSNDDAGTLLGQLAHNGLRDVVALHLSSTNNLPRLATTALQRTLRQLDHPARVACAAQQEPGDPIG